MVSTRNHSGQFSTASKEQSLKRTSQLKSILDKLYRHRGIENYRATGDAVMALYKQVGELETLLNNGGN